MWAARKAIAASAGEVPATERARYAACHPLRIAVQNGLCRECWMDHLAQTERARSPVEAKAAIAELGEEVFATQVRAYLQHNLEEYARLHIEATRIASLKGDSRPSEWALQTIKLGGAPVIQPMAKDGGGATGVKVLIGVQLGGLPPGTGPTTEIAVTPTVVEATKTHDG